MGITEYLDEVTHDGITYTVDEWMTHKTKRAQQAIVRMEQRGIKVYAPWRTKVFA